MPPSFVHFNGSVNLSDAQSVMREIGTRIPAGLRRITDGETGNRSDWIFFQIEKFAAMREFEAAAQSGDNGGYSEIPQLKLAAGISAKEVVWPKIGYADAYAESYEIFSTLRGQGTIPGDARFQLQYPTPLAGLKGIASSDRLELLGSYESALFEDLDQALATIPHDQIAIQWDVAEEIGLLTGAFSGSSSPGRDAILAGLGRCLYRVPEGVPVGVHLCYGDFRHRHFAEPDSLMLQVDLSNALARIAGRKLSWVAFTVPQARNDDAYFVPLQDLELGAETELAFGLVPYHPRAQSAGSTREQIRLVDLYLARSSAGGREWGICTECGMGRVEREDVPALLDLHREILAMNGASPTS
jgi:hypothetical protein